MINEARSGDQSAHHRDTPIDQHRRQREHHGVTMSTNIDSFILIPSDALMLIVNAAQHR